MNFDTLDDSFPLVKIVHVTHSRYYDKYLMKCTMISDCTRALYLFGEDRFHVSFHTYL